MRGKRAKQLRRLAYGSKSRASAATQYSGKKFTFINPITKGVVNEVEMIQLTAVGDRREYRRLKQLYKRLRILKVHKRAPLPRERRFREE